jgi:type I restriction enzyme S subunit
MMEHSLPSSWKRTTLAEVAAPVANAIVDGPFGSNLKLSDYVESGVPVLQGKNITNDTFQWFDVRFISDQKASELKRSSVRIGDILLVKIGSIGYSAVVRDLKGFDFAIIPANLAKVTADPKQIDTEYLHKWLTSLDAKRYFTKAASKTAQPALSLGKIKNLPVPLPPLPEQRRIAEVLDRAEALRAKRRAALAQLDTLTQSIFLNLFGDPVTNEKGMQTTNLSELCHRVTDGTHQPPEWAANGIPFLFISNILDGQIDFETHKFISEKTYLELTKRCPIEIGDVLYTTVGSYGNAAVVTTAERFAFQR